MASSAAGGSSSAGTASSSAGNSSSARTAGEWYRDFRAALCTAENNCAGTRGREYSSLAACNATLDLEEAYRVAIGQQGVDAFVNSHYAVPDPTAGQACIDAITALTGAACDVPVQTLTECNAAIDPLNAVARGSQCDADHLCDDDVDVCKPLTASNGGYLDCSTCVALISNGNACAGHDDCASGYCNPATNVCQTAPSSQSGIGVTCADGSDCLGNLRCVGQAGSTTCQPRGAVNAACDGPLATNRTHAPCLADLDCVTDANAAVGTCQARLANGQTCRRDAFSLVIVPRAAPLPDDVFLVQTAATCMNFCNYAARDSATGTCGTRTTMPVDSEPCTGLASFAPMACGSYTDAYAVPGLATSPLVVNGNTYTKVALTSCECSTKSATGACLDDGHCKAAQCNNAAFPANGTVTLGTCEPLSTRNTACNEDTDCTTGLCTASLCADPLANGQACRRDSNCASGYCAVDDVAPTCKDLLICPP
ncbi:MAG: hypothetical protein HY904_17800 [Deltaproteobacteria bacterium]|nr:hypothetical protein [Deltaproteobacteria bacterium]